MTVSKTTTQEKAQAYIEARFVSEWQQNILVPCFVDFADSLTAELQKENARLREALERLSKVSSASLFEVRAFAKVALSKEKVK